MLIDIDLIDFPCEPIKVEDLPPSLLLSIMEQGILSPITVVALENGRYRLVNGLARVSAAKALKWTQIEVEIYTKTMGLVYMRQQRVPATNEDCRKAVRKLIAAGVSWQDLSARTNIPIRTLKEWHGDLPNNR